MQTHLKPKQNHGEGQHGCITIRPFFVAGCDAAKLLQSAKGNHREQRPGGHCVLGEQQPLVACDSHTAEEIETAYQRWQSRSGTELDDEQEDEKTAPNGL